MTRLQFVEHPMTGPIRRRCFTHRTRVSPLPGISPSARIAHGSKRSTTSLDLNGTKDPAARP